MKAWITGAGGLIGNYLVQTAAQFASEWTVRPLIRGDLNLLDFDKVRDAFAQDQPDLVIHCAALSHTPSCEKDPALAHLLNVETTGLLAGLSKRIPFVFFSTDMVFDGCTGHYEEGALVHPLSVYGRTKVAAEKLVLTNSGHTVIRTSLNGGSSPTGDRGFNEQLRRAFEQRKPVTLFTDEFRCPIPAAVTAQATWELVAADRPGLYHLAGSERLSRWQIGELVAARYPQLDPQLVAASLKSYSGAPRPADSSLCCGKIQKLLSFPLPGLSEWLGAHPEIAF